MFISKWALPHIIALNYEYSVIWLIYNNSDVKKCQMFKANGGNEIFLNQSFWRRKGFWAMKVIRPLPHNRVGDPMESRGSQDRPHKGPWSLFNTFKLFIKQRWMPSSGEGEVICLYMVEPFRGQFRFSQISNNRHLKIGSDLYSVEYNWGEKVSGFLFWLWQENKQIPF